MAFKYALLITSLIFSFQSVADTISFRDGDRYKGHGYVEFERLSISDAEALMSGSGVWIALKLEFTGLKINGKEYGADGRAQISLDSHYTTASPRWDMGLKGGYCANNSDTFQFPHYSVTSLKAIVDKFNLHVGGAAIKNFGCDLRVFVGRHQPMTAEMLLNNLELSELDFVLYVLTNSETIIADAVRTSKSMSQQAKSSWRNVQKDFWSNWIGSLNKAAKFTAPFLQRVNRSAVPTKASDKSSTLCIPWALSTPPRTEVLKAIMANAQLFAGEIDTSLGGIEFCNAIRKLEKQTGNGDGKVSATEASRILAMPAHRLGAVGWASPSAPVIPEIKTRLKERELYFGPLDSRVTSQLTSALQKFDRLSGDGNGHLNLAEIAKLQVSNEQKATLGWNATFCGIELDYVPNAFDQGLDDPRGIQLGLIANNFLDGSADGIPGPKTCTAFKRYIKQYGENGTLDRDGLIDLIAKGQNLAAVKTSNLQPITTDSKQTDDARKSETPDLDKEVLRLRQLLAVSDAKVNELQTQLDASLWELNRITSLESETRAAQLQFEKSQDKIDELSKSRELDLLELDRRRARITILEGQLRTLRKEQAALNEKYQTLLAKVDESIPSSEMDIIETRLAAVEQQNKQLGEELNSQKDLNSRLKALNEEFSANQTLLKQDIVEKQRQIAAGNNEKEKLLSRISSLESKLASYMKEELAKTAWIDALTDDWLERLDDMPIQQRQFCNIASEFRHDLEEATASANQIRINMTFQERQRSLDSLLPEGIFNNWLVRVITVGQMPDGSARFIAELPCDAMIGSGTVGTGEEEKWVATIPYNDRAYRELAKVSRGDFIAIQGALLEVERFEAGQPESFYGVNKIGDNPHPEARKLGLKGEVFIAKVQYLVSLSN